MHNTTLLSSLRPLVPARHALRCCTRLAIAFCALMLAACPLPGNGERVSERRDHAQFGAVDNQSELEVLVEQGEDFEVTVAIDENLIDRVETSVVDDTLRVRTRGHFVSLVRGPHVRVTMPELTGLRVAESGDLDAINFENSEAVDVRVSGAGDLAWHGDATEIRASVSGSGDLDLEGSVGFLDLRVSGSGDASARSCVAESARVEVSGSGDATVNVEGDLDAEVSGAGDLSVYGDPRFTRRVRSGDGDIDVH